MGEASRRFDVVVVGEVNPDLILSGDVLPEFGQVEKLVRQANLTVGSSSAIFACGAARLGLRVAFIGKVGDDLFGSFMCQSLKEKGVDTRGIVSDEEIATGISVILSAGADRAILTYPGTIPMLRYTDINLEIIGQARHLHLGSYYLQRALLPDLPVLFDQAHRLGLTISLDTNYDPTEVWKDGLDLLLPKVDVFLPNATECRGITGITDLEQAVKMLSDHISYIGVKLGEKGALLYHGGELYQQDSLPVEVVDTVGAGDSFDAGFVYAYLAGWEPRRMLKLATICGSLSTQKAGGTSAQPDLEEALDYL